jgi:hypothetical protein
MSTTRVAAFARGLLAASTLAVSALAAPARALEPFVADYRATYKGVSADARIAIERQDGDRWRCTLAIANTIAQLTQVTVFEDHGGQWRPLSGTDVSHLLLVKKIQRQAVYDWASGQARWSGDVKPERAGPVALQAGDLDGLLMNLVIVRDAAAGKPLRYRLVDEGRAKPMTFSVAGKEDLTIGGESRKATKVVNASGNREMQLWIVDGLPLPARILQRKDGRDEIDLSFIAVR